MGPGEEAGLDQCFAGLKWKDLGQERQLGHRHGLGSVSNILDERDSTSGDSIWEEGSRDGMAPPALTLCPQVSSHGICVGWSHLHFVLNYVTAHTLHQWDGWMRFYCTPLSSKV